MRARQAFLVATFLSAAVVSAQQPEKSSTPTQLTDRERQEREFSQRIQNESAAVKQREADIDAELKMVNRAVLKDDDWAKEWAGTYYADAGATIKVSPKSGVTYTNSGLCSLGVRDVNHGTIARVMKEGLVLQLAIPEMASPHSYMSSRLYFVRWGKRQYLIPEAQMIRFVNNFNKGGSTRNSMIDMPRRTEPGIRPDDADEPGIPQLPDPYAQKIIKNPTSLKITKVHPRSNPTNGSVPEFDLELEGGETLGVFSGMEIDYDGGSGYGPVTINRVDKGACSGWLRLYTGGTKGPSVGDVLKLPGVSNGPSQVAPSQK